MKKKSLYIIIIVLLLGTGLFTYNINKPQEIKKINISKPKIVETKKDNTVEEINNLKKQYQNDDVIAYIEIPNILKEPIVQTTNNSYYLHHDIYKQDNIIGATFLDYRNNIDNSKKILIYSHSDPEGTLPFVKLSNYNNQDFFENNRIIYLIDSKEKRTYEVFSSYIETADFDYVNLESYNGLTYQEHLEKLKSKSLVICDSELTEDTEIIILQTCSFNSDIASSTKYQLLIAKRIK